MQFVVLVFLLRRFHYSYSIFCGQVFASRVLRHNILRVAEVFPVNFGQRGERSHQKLVILFGIAKQWICHHNLMLFILHLVEGVIVEDEGAEEFRVIKLDRFEDSGQARHLIEGDVEFAERLAP